MDHVNGVVAQNRDGEVVGFARRASFHGHPETEEFGGLVVKPECRRHGAARYLIDHHLAGAREAGKVMVSEPVCYDARGASQKLHDAKGFRVQGIEPAKYPELKPETLGRQPESVTFVMRRFEGEIWNNRRIHLPPRYSDLPARLGRTETGGHSMRSTFPGVVYHNPCRGKEIVGAEFVDVPVNWPEARRTIDDLIRQGWRFSCFLPGLGLTHSGEKFDFIRLYRHNQPIDFGLIHVLPSLDWLKDFMVQDA
jgi:GNAT superfamily N-acetyltransferase